ncbi:hypothetical protein SCALM49S_02239 [Streptomyces californicus]
MASVVAMVHDVILVVGAFAWLGLPGGRHLPGRPPHRHRLLGQRLGWWSSTGYGRSAGPTGRRRWTPSPAGRCPPDRPPDGEHRHGRPVHPGRPRGAGRRLAGRLRDRAAHRHRRRHLVLGDQDGERDGGRACRGAPDPVGVGRAPARPAAGLVASDVVHVSALPVLLAYVCVSERYNRRAAPFYSRRRGAAGRPGPAAAPRDGRPSLPDDRSRTPTAAAPLLRCLPAPALRRPSTPAPRCPSAPAGAAPARAWRTGCRAWGPRCGGR